MALPEIYTPDEVAKRLRWPERRVRSEAKRLGACMIMGNRMRLTEADVGVITKAAGILAGEILTGQKRRDEMVRPIYESRPSYEKRESAVYFVANREYIKIGWTVDWPNRVRVLQISNPDPVEVLLVLGRPKIYEKTLHRHFAQYRVRGEWFRDNPEIRDFIEDRESECWYRAGRKK